MQEGVLKGGKERVYRSKEEADEKEELKRQRRGLRKRRMGES